MAIDYIPDSHKELLTGAFFAVFTTVAPDGMPENTVVWCKMDGDHVIVNTAAGRRKDQNIRKHRKVALTVLHPEDGFYWIDVRGEVEDIVPDADYAGINSLAELYTGKTPYYGGVAPAEREGTEERIIYKIKPERVVVVGGS